jgi:hypothetical protein
MHRLLVTASIVPSSPILVTLMKELLSSSKVSVLTRGTWRNMPEDTIFHSHHHENLKSYTIIDQIITNVPTKCYHTEIINSLLSDHFAQCMVCTVIQYNLTSYTIIDQIITNIPTKCYHTEVINSLLSDHFAQCMVCIVTNITVQPHILHNYRSNHN